MISTECMNCIHEDVCGVKGCFKEAENKVNESGAGLIHPYIDIQLKCTKFCSRDENTLIYPSGVR